MDWLHVAAIDDGQVCQSSSDAQRAGAPLSHPPGCRPEGSRHSHGQLTPDGYSSLTVPAIKSISQIWRVGAAQPAAPASMRRGMRHEFAIFLHERVRVQVLRDDAARGAAPNCAWCGFVTVANGVRPPARFAGLVLLFSEIIRTVYVQRKWLRKEEARATK